MTGSAKCWLDLALPLQLPAALLCLGVGWACNRGCVVFQIIIPTTNLGFIHGTSKKSFILNFISLKMASSMQISQLDRIVHHKAQKIQNKFDP
jgi:hypothetical protein